MYEFAYDCLFKCAAEQIFLGEKDKGRPIKFKAFQQ